MIPIAVKKLVDHAIIPRKMSSHAAGYDLYSANEEVILLQPGDIKMIPTGIAMSIPEGYEAQVRPRSGLAIKHGIGILNSPGTIDSDYRGEIRVIIFNAGEASFTLEPGSRIAQMVISKYYDIEFQLADELDTTERGSGGFGHTELK
jgi:dUTP pyrophosphatase